MTTAATAPVEYDDRFHLSRKRFVMLLALSSLWFTVDGTPLLPVGLVFALRYVGSNYETTFLRSLVTGWRVVLACVGVALCSLYLSGPAFGFGVGREGVRLHLSLLG
ncbi:hypothetical protein LY474_39445 [Myxococcus stipitatus]|uniref:hypothetical protein n=1 Tax=Myxococcus stipitatus TaxID=83455 RepID=UPI001F310B43|nr:hypothetical protein [Myxococcus stipitatus]MCE9673888.1 hypothetical protein [Myxococcus stipitatus]